MENNWLYKGEKILSIEDLDPQAFGFIYIIKCDKNNKFYIGKKFLKHSKKVKLGKKAIAIQKGLGRKKRSVRVTKESDWQTYWGSCVPLKEDINLLGQENFTREIVKICYNKKQLSYWEMYYQIKLDVLEVDNCYNDHIGYYYRKDLLLK